MSNTRQVQSTRKKNYTFCRWTRQEAYLQKTRFTIKCNRFSKEGDIKYSFDNSR